MAFELSVSALTASRWPLRGLPRWRPAEPALVPAPTERDIRMTQPTTAVLIRKCSICGQEDDRPMVTYFDETPSHHIDCKKKDN
jgi:hypothetical protein